MAAGVPATGRETGAGPVLRNHHPERDGELALGFLDLLEVDFLGGWRAPRRARGGRHLEKRSEHRPRPQGVFSVWTISSPLAAFSETGSIGIVLRANWNHAPMWDRARLTLIWWRIWVETIAAAQPGSLWQSPLVPVAKVPETLLGDPPSS